MNILVCVKRVPAPGSKINVTSDGMAVDAAHLGFTTSPHEECALEEAVQITERDGGQVTVLTLGPVEAEEQLRYAASVGAHKIILVPTDGSAWDPQRTASALTEAIQTAEEANNQPFELILFGNESADSGGFQVGVRVAHKLGRPIVNAVKGIDPSDCAVTARREIDAGFEVYNVPTPAVLGVKEGINLPRYPTMKGRLASKKAELTNAEITAKAGRPAEQASNTEILGTDESAAVAIVDILEEIGVC